MNNYLYERLTKWGLRRHGNKTIKWVFNRYWKHIDGRWTFTGTTPENDTYTLAHYNLGQKRTGARISSYINVFDLKNKIKVRRAQLSKMHNLPYQKGLLDKKQQGICPGCNQLMDPTKSNILDLHHVIPKKDGGLDKLTNLLLLHEHCHYESHSNKLFVSQKAIKH